MIPGSFRPQLRALLRASTLGDLRILFPLVSTLAELRDARAVLDDVAAELKAQGHSVRDRLPIGIMVEVPAAALMADQFAKEVDFFSIGTNDLTQYTLAVDRTNETVADLYCAADPAVLRLIAMVVEAAKSHGIEVSVCGTMGGEPLYTMLLLGLGLKQLSMPPHQLPEIKRLIRGMRIEAARAVAAEVLGLMTAQEVVERLTSALRQVSPERHNRSSDRPERVLARHRPRRGRQPGTREAIGHHVRGRDQCRSAPPPRMVRGQTIRLTHASIGANRSEPSRFQADRLIGLTIGDGQGSASPKWAPAVERGSPTDLEIGIGPRVRFSAACASAGYDRSHQSATPIRQVWRSPPGQPS